MLALGGLLASADASAHFGPLPIPLSGIEPPAVPGLVDGPAPIVVDEAAAIALGKALFWDTAVGSDGIACASCHFHAGADRRVANQLAPGGVTLGEPDLGFSEDHAPNQRLERGQFPLHQTDAPLLPTGSVVRSSNDVVGSSGSFGGGFDRVEASTPIDVCARAADPVFHAGALGGRRVEPRNAPSVINAVFNHRNLWDGGANNVFNGSSAWGERDPAAGVWVRTPGGVEWTRLSLPHASLASQALSPPLNAVEMSCETRRFADLGRKLACRQPLANQNVHWDDGVLGRFALSTPGDLRRGLATTYAELVRAAFDSRYWSSEERGGFGAPSGDGAQPYGQLEANFAMFFGLAIQLYQATLVSDDSPFDRSARAADGTPIDLSESAQRGFQEFRVAHCGLCHIGPVFTSAALVTNAELMEADPLAFGEEYPSVSTTRNVLTRMGLAGMVAFIDTGFANNGATDGSWDAGLGGSDPFGHPLSFSDQYLQHLAGNAAGVVDPHVVDVRACDLDVSIARNQTRDHPAYFTLAEGVIAQPQGTEDCYVPNGGFLPTPAAAAAELASPDNTKMRSAALASFKIPSLRNVELTGPYMHNGGMATLEEVLEFYTRGGNFEDDVKHVGSVFPQVQLRLSAQARADVVAFLQSLTDERVRYERAPFDHPEIAIPHGHHAAAGPLGPDLALDRFLIVPAVGASGRGAPLEPFEAFLTPCGDACADQASVALATDTPPYDFATDPDVCPAPEPAGGALAAAAALLARALRTKRQPPG
jgi:cytochrome c peroxidase